MKNKMMALLLTALMIPAAGLAQQTRVLTADKSNEYGLVYTLPVTALHIELTAKKSVERRGPFYQYAKKYLATDKVVTEDSQQWQLTAGSLSTYGVADPETQYLIQLKPGAVTNICVDKNGMLLAINQKVEAPEVVSEVSSPISVMERHIDPAKEYLQYVDEDFIASQSLAKQAQMLAESLMEVREAKIALTRGTADPMPTDGHQLELMLNSLDRQEKALTAAFVGETWTETQSRFFDAVPEGNGKTILCRLSDFDGFVDAKDLSGEPIAITVEVVTEGALPVDARGEEKKLPKDAVIYNIPGSAAIAISANGKEVVSGEFRFAQFGVAFGLNPLLFSDKKDPYSALFDPATGALLEINAISSSTEK